MNNKKGNNNYKFNIVLCISAIAITLFAIINGSYIRKGYDIQIGTISTQKFFANSKMVNEAATQRLIKAAENEVATLYTLNTEVNKSVISELDNFFLQLRPIKDRDSEINNYNAPIGITSRIYLTGTQVEILTDLNTNELSDFSSVVYKITSAALEQGIRQETKDTALVAVKEDINATNISEDLKNIAYTIISSALDPNLIADIEATNKAKEERASLVEPVMILENQKIVDEGEIITEDIYQLLESQGYVQKSNLRNNIMPIIGIITLILLLFTCIFMYIYHYQSNIYKNRHKGLLLFTVYVFTVLVTTFTTNLPYMFVPVVFFTMLVSLLFNIRFAVFSNMIVTFVCMMIYKGDLAFVTYFLIAGTITAILASTTTERNRILGMGIIVSSLFVFIMLGVTLYFDLQWKDNIALYLIYAFISGIINLIVVIGSLPIWESVFGIITNFKLMELINPDKSLMRRLMMEAPGTYHHSLIVSNLAEAAAYNIGANPVLARVGAYYHDIGKLKSPMYFGENNTGKSLHDNVNPYDSAKIIINHVQNGIDLGKKNKLPQVILDIINEHHGNTSVKFFEHKAIQLYGEDNVEKSDFRYPYHPPTSKESAVVMLADTVEAAVRSKKDSGMKIEEIEQFVRKLIKDKLDDGQLNSSELTLKDIDIIVLAFMDIFKGMYHERITYPEDNKSEDYKKGE